MTRVRVATTIHAPRRVVWDALADVASHVEWMHDAVEIRFVTARQRGIGTVFECDTRVGPLRLTDVMEITEWVPRRRMGVRHVGVVTGEGCFELRRSLRPGATRFVWDERLMFPWWLGGPFGGVVGGLVLRLVWRRNLVALRRRIEGSGDRQ
jgi:hypothetical protein